MNLFKNKTIFLIFLVLGLSACTKDFEKEPLEFVTSDYLWNAVDVNGTYAEQFLIGVYTSLADRLEISGISIDAATDDAVPSAISAPIYNVDRNGYSPTAPIDDYWGSAYAGIRKANIFLANYQRVPWADANKAVWFPSEARFLRAWFYYEMLRRYGGVPLVGDKVLSLSDNIQLPRNSFDECVQYILNECDSIKDVLRPETALSARASDGNSGRITQGCAYALKAKVLLLAASPLYNTTNDVTKWQAAADAARALINKGTFQLEPNFLTPFIQRANKETILYRQATATGAGDMENKLAPVGYVSAGTASQGQCSPTQELVDAFPDKNGVAITDPATVYDPANPYANRDPRLYNTVFHNGMKWLNRNVETFEGGKDKPNSSVTPVQTQTGYYQRKWCADFSVATSYSTHDHNWIFMRYADILLGFAEAQNEVEAAPTPEIYQTLYTIRQRAGIPAGGGGTYGLPAGMSQSEMRDVIRNERRIELAFESQRFFDVRRWKTAENLYNKLLTEMQITKNADNSFSYQRVTNVQGPYFNPASMYLYPINSTEVLKDPKLVQNPGY